MNEMEVIHIYFRSKQYNSETVSKVYNTLHQEIED